MNTVMHFSNLVIVKLSPPRSLVYWGKIFSLKNPDDLSFFGLMKGRIIQESTRFVLHPAHEGQNHSESHAKRLS